jgi:site-specific recombinase XerD
LLPDLACLSIRFKEHNAHTFRRTFASNLHRKGVDVEHIMRLGGWETLDMVLRYTRSVKFEESLRLYRGVKDLE